MSPVLDICLKVNCFPDEIHPSFLAQPEPRVYMEYSILIQSQCYIDKYILFNAEQTIFERKRKTIRNEINFFHKFSYH